MAVKTVGELLREARTGAGMTQMALAKAAGGVTATEISKAERGEKELSKEQLKAIAKATGVTQKSLLDAPFGPVGASSQQAAAKPAGSSAKPSATASQKPSSSAGLSLNANNSKGVKLSDDEKKLIEAFRSADDKTKKTVLEALGLVQEDAGLGGLASGLLGSLLGGGNQNAQAQSGGGAGNLLGAVLGGALGGGQSSQSQQNAGGGLMGTLLSAVGLREGEEMPEGEEPVIYEVKKDEPKPEEKTEAEEKPKAKKPAAKKPAKKATEN